MKQHGPDERPYYLFEPNRHYVWEDTPVRIRKNGLRTDPVSIPKPPSTFRVLNLGDSVVFGWRVSEEHTYGERLEAMLNQLNDGLDYEVSNVGIPGWNLTMARNFLVEGSLEHHPDLIVLDITLANDVYGADLIPFQGRAWTRWLRDHTYAWPFLTIEARLLLARQRGPEAFPVLSPPRLERAYWPLREEDRAWRVFWENIFAIQDTARARGSRLIILAFPTAFQLNSTGHSDFPQRLLARRAQEAKIDFVDLLPTYREVCEQAKAGACEGYENLLFADVWMHPNELGHELAAEALAQKLASIR